MKNLPIKIQIYIKSPVTFVDPIMNNYNDMVGGDMARVTSLGK